jgi:hypothetical protein
MALRTDVATLQRNSAAPFAAVAREYARGRLLEVATTDLDKQETWRRAIAVAHLVCKA